MALNNADPTNTFIVGNGIPDEKYSKELIADVDSYPLHFMMHTIHAAEIIGYKHPDEKMRTWWIKFYRELVKGLHLNPEIEEQLDVRLGFTPAEREAMHQPVNEDADRFDWADSKPQPISEPEPPAPKPRKVTPPRKVKVKGLWQKGTGTSHNNRGY